MTRPVVARILFPLERQEGRDLPHPTREVSIAKTTRFPSSPILVPRSGGEAGFSARACPLRERAMSIRSIVLGLLAAVFIAGFGY
ncbi:MAG TPA: hypothetical protein PK082_11580, partial [Phycisphaerae bacterium]|nr:hypothetical protein [Phycisphaerae bacterium]